jgi:hypothetical protein
MGFTTPSRTHYSFQKVELGWHNCILKVGMTAEEVSKAQAICKVHAQGDGDDDADNYIFLNKNDSMNVNHETN